MCVVGGGRELSGVGALTISICRRVCHGVRGGHEGDGPGFGAGSVMECGVAMEGMVLVSVRGLSWSAGGHGGDGPGFGARSVMECGVAMEGMVLVSVRGLSWSAGWPWRGWSWFRCEVCHGVRVAMEGMVLVSVRGLSWSAGWPWRGWSWFRCGVCHGVRGGHGGDGPGFGASLALGTSCGQSSNSLQSMCSIKENTRIIYVDIILH